MMESNAFSAIHSPVEAEKESPVDATTEEEPRDESTFNAAKCSYRDFSHILPQRHSKESSAMIAQSKSAKDPTFPAKLHAILSNPDCQDIISWLPHGRSWRILQHKAFEERVIPLYFRHGRYSSFARQVNGWGFRRVTYGSDYNSYYHEFFLRGMPHLLGQMRRLTTKDISKQKKPEEERSPDFYVMSQRNPLPDSTGSSVAKLAEKEQAQKELPQVLTAVPGNGFGNDQAAQVELALLERRRADILKGINLLSQDTAPPQISNLGANSMHMIGGISPMMTVGNLGQLAYPASLTQNRNSMLGSDLDIIQFLRLKMGGYL